MQDRPKASKPTKTILNHTFLSLSKPKLWSSLMAQCNFIVKYYFCEIWLYASKKWVCSQINLTNFGFLNYELPFDLQLWLYSQTFPANIFIIVIFKQSFIMDSVYSWRKYSCSTPKIFASNLVLTSGLILTY
jgi:hypothetical protein